MSRLRTSSCCTRRCATYSFILPVVLTIVAFAGIVVQLKKYSSLCSGIPLIFGLLAAFAVGAPLLLLIYLGLRSRGANKSKFLFANDDDDWCGSRESSYEPDHDKNSLLVVSQSDAFQSYEGKYGASDTSCCQRSTYLQCRDRSCRHKLCLSITVIAVVIMVLAMLISWGFAIALTVVRLDSLPELYKTQSLNGLYKEVHIARNESNAMYHVHADNLEDMYFAQGYAHAQFRMFQMEIQRRVGMGRVSELSGKGGLTIDRFTRTMGIEAAAKRAWQYITTTYPDHVAVLALNSYTQGVNAYISQESHLPIEFTLLNLKPEPWQPFHSLMWAKMMSYELSANMAEELDRIRISELTNNTRERADTMLPPYNYDETPIILSDEDLPPNQLINDTLDAFGMLDSKDSKNSRTLSKTSQTLYTASLEAIQQRLTGRTERSLEAKATASRSTFSDGIGLHVSHREKGTFRSSLSAHRADTCTGGVSLGELWNQARSLLSIGSALLGITDSGEYVQPLQDILKRSKSRRHGLSQLPNTGFGASNNWVVGSNLSATGKPLMCNDPHLGLSAPSVWILNALYSHNETHPVAAVGASFPGIPSVVLGHNERISWAVTNGGTDVQDLYILDVNSDGTKYKYKGNWRSFDITKERISVRGKDAEEITIRRSVFGPVVTDNKVVKNLKATLALRWSSIDLTIPDTTVMSFVEINFAKNWTEFRNALRHYVAPSQNFIFASVDGDIGYQLPGLIPLRSANHTGAWPVPGNGNPEYEWQGFIDFDDLPRTHNPPEGFIVTANNRITPLQYKYHLTSDWNSGPLGYRAERITDMILKFNASTNGQLSQDHMRQIQADYVSLQAHDIITRILLPIDKTSNNPILASAAAKYTTDSEQLRQVFLNWDFDEKVGCYITPWYARFYRELTRLGGAQANESYYENAGFLLNALTSDTTQAQSDAACVTNEFGENKRRFTSCAEFVVASLNNVSANWKASTGGVAQADSTNPFQNSGAPRWGLEEHKAEFASQSLGGSPLACLANRYAKHGGDRSTVNVGSFSLDTDSFIQDHGPSFRAVMDLATIGTTRSEKQQKSQFLNPMGQSGNIFSQYYADLNEDWSDSTYLSMYLQNDDQAGKIQTLNPE